MTQTNQKRDSTPTQTALQKENYDDADDKGNDEYSVSRRRRFRKDQDIKVVSSRQERFTKQSRQTNPEKSLRNELARNPVSWFNDTLRSSKTAIVLRNVGA